MQKFRIRAGSVLAGVVTVRPSSHGLAPGEAIGRRVAVAPGGPVPLPGGPLPPSDRSPPSRGRRPAPVPGSRVTCGCWVGGTGLVSSETGPQCAQLRRGRATQHQHRPRLPADIRGSRVANIKSQIKRIKTNEIARKRNVAVKSSLKTQVRRFRSAAEAGDKEAAATALQIASKALDKAASKGIIHKNQAANRKSALAKKVASL
nr:30S ribosomal protein S20 [Modestobacter muralis]